MSVSNSNSNKNINLQELNETVDRLSSMPNVEAVLILNRNGDIVAGEDSKRAMACQKLLECAKGAVQSRTDVDDDEDISFLQIRSSSGRELMMVPHEGFCLAVVKKAA